MTGECSTRRPCPRLIRYRILDRSGNIRTMHAVVAMIPGTRKSIASFIDISEQKRSEEALTMVNRKLNLLSSITRHDIINQLMILKGFLAILKQKIHTPELLDSFGRIDNAARNIEHQITFTRDYQDMGVKAPSWYSIRNTSIAAKGALSPGPVTIEIDQQDIEVFADPLFEKVFYNLIDNSLKYGGAQLRTIRIFSEEKGDSLVITCQDDGVGISDTDRKHLFERGFGKHTGLGLFLSREILSITGITIRETGKPGSVHASRSSCQRGHGDSRPQNDTIIEDTKLKIQPDFRRCRVIGKGYRDLSRKTRAVSRDNFRAGTPGRCRGFRN